MAGIDLADIELELKDHGYAQREGTLPDVNLAAIQSQSWQRMLQAREATVATLRPTERSQARTRTLSAVYGLAAQPLHTDGAHLRTPPDIVVLHAQQPNETPTVVWKLDERFPSALSSGVFTVRGNEGSYLAHAYEGRRLRFDPVCMSPADYLAKEAQSYFQEARERAHEHEWLQRGTLLFIDNRRALHARNAVDDERDAASRVLEREIYTLRSGS